MTNETTTQHPVFTMFPDDETLSRLTGYNKGHLFKIRRGYRPASADFRKKVAAALRGWNIDELFLPE